MITIMKIPPSVNNCWRHRVVKGKPLVYLTKEGKEYKKLVAEELTRRGLDKISKEDMQKEIKLCIYLTFPTKRRVDIDNRLKIILDSLTGFIYEDDSQVVVLHVTKEYQKNIEKVEIIPTFL